MNLVVVLTGPYKACWAKRDLGVFSSSLFLVTVLDHSLSYWSGVIKCQAGS